MSDIIPLSRNFKSLKLNAPKILLCAVATCLLSGCANPQFIRTGVDSKTEFSPTLKDSIDTVPCGSPEVQTRASIGIGERETLS
jgi:hypothetical protein